MIEREIKRVANTLSIDRMPSASEMDMVTGSSSLSNKVSKTGGFYSWASKLNLKVKNSETQTGKGFETVAVKMILDKGYEVKRMTTKYPFDLLVNNNISIDVKVGRRHCIGNSRLYTIGINKKYATCDLYMIFALNEEEKVEKLLIIPGNELKVTTMNFGKHSIYDKYIDRWDYIEKYDKFYKQLA